MHALPCADRIIMRVIWVSLPGCMKGAEALQGLLLCQPVFTSKGLSQVQSAGQAGCCIFAGLSLEQAQVLAELFSTRFGLLANPAPCNIAELQSYYSR